MDTLSWHQATRFPTAWTLHPIHLHILLPWDKVWRSHTVMQSQSRTMVKSSPLQVQCGSLSKWYEVGSAAVLEQGLQPKSTLCDSDGELLQPVPWTKGASFGDEVQDVASVDWRKARQLFDLSVLFLHMITKREQYGDDRARQEQAQQQAPGEDFQPGHCTE